MLNRLQLGLLLGCWAVVAGPVWGQEPLHTRIDRLMDAAAVSPVAPPCTDGEFARRVHLDLVGMIPTVAEARAFLDDSTPNKRELLVDRLLADPRHPLHLASAFNVMWMERRADKNVTAAHWINFLNTSFQQQKPYHQLVQEILSADDVNPATRPAAKFLLDRDGDPHLLTRDIGRMFFGVDMQCAQCHDHPLIDDYVQTDYYGLYAFVSRVSLVMNPKDNTQGFLAEKSDGVVEFKSVFTGNSGKTRPRLLGANELDEPRFHLGDDYLPPAAPNAPAKPKFSRRVLLGTSLADGSNPQFRRNIVNRMWAKLMGRGLVHPVDLHHSDNPPSHPEVLDLLAEEIKTVNFQLRPLLRELALTKAYQRSVDLPAEPSVSPESAAWLAAGKSEQDKFIAATEAVKAEQTKLLTQLTEASKALVPLEEALAKADAAVVALKKPYDDANTALVTAQQQHAAKQAALATVNDAIAKGTEAAKLFPNDAEVASAIAVFQARGQKTMTEIEAAAKVVADQTPVVQAALGKLNEAHAAGDAAYAQLVEARKPIDVIKSQIVAAQNLQRAHNAQTQRWKQRTSRLQAVIDYPTRKSSLAASETAVVAAQAEHVAANQALATVQGSVEAKQLADAKTAALSEAVAKRNADAAALNETLTALTTHGTSDFSVRDLKPLSPDQIGWSVMQAGGFVDIYRNNAEVEIEKTIPKASVEADPVKKQERIALVEAKTQELLLGVINTFVSVFGAGPGQPQEDFFATPDQALFVANGTQLKGWTGAGTALFNALNAQTDPQRFAEDLYLGLLTRRPTDQEVAAVTSFVAARPTERPAVVEELLWALIASAEFRFQR